MKNAFTNNRILLKSLYCAIIDKAFNFSPVFFANGINVIIYNQISRKKFCAFTIIYNSILNNQVNCIINHR